MTTGAARQEPLYLSVDETAALVDVCLPCMAGADPTQIRALQKLMSLANRYKNEREPVEAGDREMVGA